MPVTNDDLQDFYKFALGVIKTEVKPTSVKELAEKWDAQREREFSNEAIRQGHSEIEAGGGKPYMEFRAETNAKYDLSSE